MLKVYQVEYYYSVDGGKWVQVRDTSEVLEDRDGLPNEEIIFDSYNWNQIMDHLSERSVLGVYKDETFFQHRPYFYCVEEDYYDAWSVRFFEDGFDTFSYKAVYTENKNVSLHYIIKEFPAEKCIQYMKEHGMIIYPINNTK